MQMLRFISQTGKHDYVDFVDESTGHICQCCDSLQSSFYDEYYSKNNIWYFHIDENKYQVSLMDYDTVHSILGCKVLQILNRKCPRPILIPMATALSYCHSNNLQRLNGRERHDSINSKFISRKFNCLYRNDDGAVGLDFGTHIFYLTPSNIKLNHIRGFDIVTQRQHP